MKIKEMNQTIDEQLPKVKGIIDKKSGKFYLQGENPYMDMQIENYLLCPEEYENGIWFGFVKANYELRTE